MKSFCPSCKDVCEFTVTFDGAKSNGVPWKKGTCQKCNFASNDLAQNLSTTEYVLNFGKYKGKPLKEVPLSYLAWLHDQPGTSLLMKWRIESLQTAQLVTNETI